MVTSKLSIHAAQINWSNLPDSVKRTTINAIVDHIACAAGGLRTDWGAMARNATLRLEGPGQTSILGEHKKFSPSTAAFMHGHYGNMLDFDDTLHDLGHPGTCIIPAALAVAEHEGCTSQEFLSSIVAGYEVAGRFGMGTRSDDMALRKLIPTGWHTIGATVAAARALGLEAEGIRRAIGIAAERAPVAIPVTTDTTYAFKSGKMGAFSSIGVRAAYAAAEGMHGKLNALDESTPYWQSFGSNTYNIDAILSNLNSQWVMDDLSFKPYPSCRFTHTAVEAALSIQSSLELDEADAIETICVRTFSRALQLVDPVPANAAMGPFCFPYVVAVACLGIPFEHWYSSETRSLPEITRLANRVQLEAIHEFDKIVDTTAELPSEVSVTTANGRSESKRIIHALGGPARALSHEEIERKFRTFVPQVLGEVQTETLWQKLQGIDSQTGSIQPLTKLLRSKPSPDIKGAI